MIQLSKCWWVLNQIDLKATAICTIIIARFLFTSQLVFQLHPFTPPSSPGTSIFLEGLLGSFFFTGFNWNLKKSRSQVDSELHQQHKGFRVALHILFVYLPDLCHFSHIYLSILQTFSSCYIPPNVSSIHQGTWCTHLHKPIVPRRVDLAKLSLLGYVPGRKQVPEMQQLKFSVSGMERFCVQPFMDCPTRYYVRLQNDMDTNMIMRKSENRKIKRLHTSDLLGAKRKRGNRTSYHFPQPSPFVARALVLKSSYVSCKPGKPAITT